MKHRNMGTLLSSGIIGILAGLAIPLMIPHGVVSAGRLSAAPMMVTNVSCPSFCPLGDPDHPFPEGVTFGVHLSDSAGAPIGGQVLLLVGEGTDEPVAAALTDESGTARFVVYPDTLPEAKPGEYPYSVRFAGDSQFRASSGSGCIQTVECAG